LRIDTIPEVPKWFWKEFSDAAGVYQVGEVFDPRLDYVADYQNYVDAVLNYPLYFAMKNVFQSGHSMREIEYTLGEVKAKFKDPSILGVFVNNHDNPRFLFNSQSYKNFVNSLALSILTSKTYLTLRWYSNSILWR
jgi:alpha-amylase